MQPDPAFPGPHPEPPNDFERLELPFRTIQQFWYRIHGASRNPLYFGTQGRARFDDPKREFGVLYVAEDAFCSFVEVFTQPTIYRIIDRSAIANRRLSMLATTQPLQLVDLSGEGLARLGADARLIAGDHAVAQRWSRALFHHPSQPDGILYRARHDPSRFAAAVFDRAAPQFIVEATIDMLATEYLPRLVEILDAYRYSIDGG